VIEKNRAGLVHHLGTLDGDREEKAQASQRGVNRRRRCTVRGQVQLEAPKVLGISTDWRTVQKIAEVLHRADVAALGLGAKLAQLHVFEHALA